MQEEKRSEDQKLKYYELNKDTAKGIRKHIGENQWEKELEEKIREPWQNAANTLVIPVLRRCAERYHQETAKWKEKAAPANKPATQKLYKAKAGGQWAICKNLGSRQAAPLTALKRDQAGPKGQPKGTIATSPKEVDSIIRRIYGKIYKREFQQCRKTSRRVREQICGVHLQREGGNDGEAKRKRHQNNGSLHRGVRSRTRPMRP